VFALCILEQVSLSWLKDKFGCSEEFEKKLEALAERFSYLEARKKLLEKEQQKIEKRKNEIRNMLN